MEYLSVNTHSMGIPTARSRTSPFLHAGGKFGGGGYKVSGGLARCRCVCCKRTFGTSLTVDVYESRSREHVHYQEYTNAVKPTCSRKSAIGDTDKTGTKITFQPRRRNFRSCLNLNTTLLLKRLREQAFLNDGVRIVFHR